MAQLVDVASFLPDAFSKEKLPIETADNIQYVANLVDAKEQTLFNKYRSNIGSQAIIDELGLGYLTDFVLAAGYTMTQLRGILVILHHYKGTRFGVEMLLNLLGMTGLTGTASLVEWWESPTTPGLVLPAAQRAAPNTYKIKITLVGGAPTPVAVFQEFNKVSPQYVLPLLDIGTIVKGITTVFVEAIGSAHYKYNAIATAQQSPIYYIQVIGRANVTIPTTAVG